MTCTHPPARLYVWSVSDCEGHWLCFGCCDCGYSWNKPIANPNRPLDRPTKKGAKR